MKTIQITEQDIPFPVVELLTGRGFVNGKSDSGKSNTVGVTIEELLEESMPCLIVDTEGEYYGLKEEYEVLHIGADEECDLQVSVEHAEKIAELCLDQNIPVILDVSGYLDEETQEELIDEVLRQLFFKEKKKQKPFLVVVEEAHEFVPEGETTGCSKIILKIAKRGRKRGLGIMGITQRPASMDKDFITQCNWKVWHKLDWSNDLEVVRKVLERNKPRVECIDEEECSNCGTIYALDQFDDLSDAECTECGTDPRNWREVISNLEPGEGILEADFLDFKALQVKFKRKRTFDAGATPDLDDFEEPELKSVDSDLMEELQNISEEKRKRQDRIQELQDTIESLEDDKEQLQDELEMEKRNSQTVDRLAEKIAQIGEGGVSKGSEALEEIKEEKNKQIQELERKLQEEREKKDQLEEELEQYEELEEYREKAEKWEENQETVEEAISRLQEVFGMESSVSDERLKKKLQSQKDKIEELKEERKRLQEESGDVKESVIKASDKSTYNAKHFWDVLTTLAKNGKMKRSDLVPYLDVADSSVKKILSKLDSESVVTYEKSEEDGRARVYKLNTEGMEDIIEQKREREEIQNLRDQVMNNE